MSKEMTMNDVVQAVMFNVAGILVLALWTTIDTLPHSGWVFIFGISLSVIGLIRYLYKFFKQPINDNEQQNQTEVNSKWDFGMNTLESILAQ